MLHTHRPGSLLLVPSHVLLAVQTSQLCVVLGLQPFQIGHCDRGSSRDEKRVVESDDTGFINCSEDGAEGKVVGTGLVGGSDSSADDKVVRGEGRCALGIWRKLRSILLFNTCITSDEYIPHFKCW